MSNGGQIISSGGGTRRVAAGESLADILDRVLDKGIVIAGDISIALVGVELLTIKIRLLIASADKAKEMGIDWWRDDPFLTGRKQDEEAGGSERLTERIAALEQRLTAAESAPAGQAKRTRTRR